MFGGGAFYGSVWSHQSAEVLSLCRSRWDALRTDSADNRYPISTVEWVAHLSAEGEL